MANIKVSFAVAESLRGYIKLKGGWIALFNGYQYKATLFRKNWRDSQKICRKWGGDLVVYGVNRYGSANVSKRVIWFFTYINFANKNTTSDTLEKIHSIICVARSKF